MKLNDANFRADATAKGNELDHAAATLAAERTAPDFYRNPVIKGLFVAAFLVGNLLSFTIVRQGLLTMETFSHVSWLTDGWFETLLAGLVQVSLLFFGLMFTDRIRRWSAGLTWLAAVFALCFWMVEIYFGVLTQALGGVAPEIQRQMEVRSSRLQVEIGALGADIASEYQRQVSLNRREAENEERGVGLTRMKGCFEQCRSFQVRAMALERRFGALGLTLPAPALGDLNVVLIDAGVRLKLLDERAALLPAFSEIAKAGDKEKAFLTRLSHAKREYALLTKVLDDHPSISRKALAADYAAGLLKRIAHGEFERVAAREWMMMFYGTIFIFVTLFLALLLAIYNRNASSTGLKARRAQELHVDAELDREVAEGEAQAGAAKWIAKLRARFWRGISN